MHLVLSPSTKIAKLDDSDALNVIWLVMNFVREAVEHPQLYSRRLAPLLQDNPGYREVRSILRLSIGC